MWIEPDFVIRVSPDLRRVTAESKQTVEWLLSFDGKQLMLPKRFQPGLRASCKTRFQCTSFKLELINVVLVYADLEDIQKWHH